MYIYIYAFIHIYPVGEQLYGDLDRRLQYNDRGTASASPRPRARGGKTSWRPPVAVCEGVCEGVREGVRQKACVNVFVKAPTNIEI